jgi:hypothetical protein
MKTYVCFTLLARDVCSSEIQHLTQFCDAMTTLLITVTLPAADVIQVKWLQ